MEELFFLLMDNMAEMVVKKIIGDKQKQLGMVDVDGMNRWATENKVSFVFETQVDLAAFDGEDLPASRRVQKSYFKRVYSDLLANDKTTIGNYNSHNIPGA